MSEAKATYSYERARLVSHLFAVIGSNGVASMNQLREFIFDVTPNVTDAVFHDTLQGMVDLRLLEQLGRYDPGAALVQSMDGTGPKYSLFERTYVRITKSDPALSRYNDVDTYDIALQQLSDHYPDLETRTRMNLLDKEISAETIPLAAQIIHTAITSLPPPAAAGDAFVGEILEQSFIPMIIGILASRPEIIDYHEVKAYVSMAFVRAFLRVTTSVRRGAVVYMYQRIFTGETPTFSAIEQELVRYAK
jgi:hypothetical protein